MPAFDPTRRDDMVLPTFVDLEELLFSTLRLHESATVGTSPAPAPTTAKPESAQPKDTKAS